MIYKSGTSKAGKPYAGSFCQDQACKFVVWDDQKPAPRPPARVYQPRPAKNEPNWDKIRAEKAEGQSFGNAKNCAAVLLGAAIQSSQLNYDDAVARFEKLVQFIYEIDDNDKKQTPQN